MLLTILSGGQTGVDRAALDAAIHSQIQHSGWCPRGRRAEDGVISSKYELKETESEDYEERTSFNIRDSSATLILIPSGRIVESISDGTILTLQELKRLSKPRLIINVSDNDDINQNSTKKCLKWLATIEPKVLNIAGPRESTIPHIYDKSFRFLCRLFEIVKQMD